MRCNERTQLLGLKVTLVPYCRQHVETYHGWMSDPWLREMTASEPLSLEEEYANQESWRVDERKATFIVLDRTLEGLPMAGDVNVYLLDEGVETGEEGNDEIVAEIEVMIAAKRSREKGLAEEALSLMMNYAAANLHISTFVAKILEINEEVRKVAAFGEVHLSLQVTPQIVEEWRKKFAYVSEETFDRGDIKNLG